LWSNLHPGETVEDAVFGRPAGSFGRSVAFGVGGLAGDVASGRAAWTVMSCWR